MKAPSWTGALGDAGHRSTTVHEVLTRHASLAAGVHDVYLGKHDSRVLHPSQVSAGWVRDFFREGVSYDVSVRHLHGSYS